MDAKTILHRGALAWWPESSPRHSLLESRDNGMSWLAHMVVTIFRIWPDRWKQRRDLREMDDDRLHDLGIGRSEAKREGEKPFWQ
ncbi:DUF1127 domain-containing protein [Aquamicrobium lusatiense]|uniref:DUF1127 domain-containing protein n=1 Tax=Aquamicrobium lusatiense TaxID=89772 RepID=UPI0024574473|nr:DUF1127 domain-containing protein [Aquamicrobium lusatiense]MDH4990640.1 DUF1127 domain-containing protein [Aquamicrobium lusatiense]